MFTRSRFLLLSLGLALVSTLSAWAGSTRPDWDTVSLEVLVQDVRSEAKAQGLKSFQVEVKDRSVSILYRDLVFPPNSPQVTAETRSKVQKLAKVLARFQGKTILVEGHTAQVPGQVHDQFSQDLSQDRASAIAGALADTGLFAKETLQSKGWGDHRPLSATDLNLNRRVEISVVDTVAALEAAPEAAPVAVVDSWWHTLSDLRGPGYLVIYLPGLSALPSPPPAGITVYVLNLGLVLVYDRATFQGDGAEPDDRTRAELAALAAEVAEWKALALRVGGFAGVAGELSLDRQQAVVRALGASAPLAASHEVSGDQLLARVEAPVMPVAQPLVPVSRAAVVVEVTRPWLPPVSGLDLVSQAALPMGRYSEFSNAGFGAGVGLAVGTEALRWHFGAGGFSHLPEMTSSVETLWELEWHAGLGYRWGLGEGLGFSLRPAYGGTVHLLSAARWGLGQARGQAFYDQTASVEGEWEVVLSRHPGGSADLSLLVTPGYRVFFEQGFQGHSPTLRLGLRYGLDKE